MRYAQLMQVHDNVLAIDVRLDNNQVITGIPVMMGVWRPDPLDESPWIAIIDSYGDSQNYVCLGFVPATVNNQTFPGNRAMNLHHSDAYFTIDENANMEAYHPSGAFVRIGEGGHEDLTGTDFHGNFSLTKNTGRDVVITMGVGAMVLTLSSAGLTVTGGDITADGISLKTHKHGGVTAGGDDTEVAHV